jgi:hypothetical protein
MTGRDYFLSMSFFLLDFVIFIDFVFFICIISYGRTAYCLVCRYRYFAVEHTHVCRAMEAAA